MSDAYLKGSSDPLVARPVAIAIDVAGVRDIDVSQLTRGMLALGMGANSARLWAWDGTSMLADNGSSVLQPTAVPGGQPGRFIAVQFDFQGREQLALGAPVFASSAARLADAGGGGGAGTPDPTPSTIVARDTLAESYFGFIGVVGAEATTCDDGLVRGPCTNGNVVALLTYGVGIDPTAVSAIEARDAGLSVGNGTHGDLTLQAKAGSSVALSVGGVDVLTAYGDGVWLKRPIVFPGVVHATDTGFIGMSATGRPTVWVSGAETPLLVAADVASITGEVDAVPATVVARGAAAESYFGFVGAGMNAVDDGVFRGSFTDGGVERLLTYGVGNDTTAVTAIEATDSTLVLGNAVNGVTTVLRCHPSERVAIKDSAGTVRAAFTPLALETAKKINFSTGASPEVLPSAVGDVGMAVDGVPTCWPTGSSAPVRLLTEAVIPPRLVPTDSHTKIEWVFDATGYANTLNGGVPGFTPAGGTPPVTGYMAPHSRGVWMPTPADSMVSVQTDYGADSTVGYTLHGWTKPTLYTANGCLSPQRRHSVGTGLRLGLVQGVGAGQWNLVACVGGVALTFACGAAANDPEYLRLHEWQHLAVTITNAGSVHVYHNGTPVKAAALGGPIDFGADPTLGFWSCAGGAALNMWRVEYVVRSASYIDAVYRRTMGLFP